MAEKSRKTFTERSQNHVRFWDKDLISENADAGCQSGIEVIQKKKVTPTWW
ncbi:hypothetical protein [Alteromonas lipolytica]|uniref:hypothetical protein n=1 Tax=Alteromonas lipolytica TaxID=1856405 RepID=UPI001586157C|nr:hypothetical protein [Alteromonas lipolytica]GGF68456.1 hypothetical protein GCM10011338_20820 [Alteromonas lipolytica]